MTLELTSEQEALVLQRSIETGKTPVELLLESIGPFEWMDDEEERELIEARFAEADRGEFVPADEMQARFERMLRPR